MDFTSQDIAVIEQALQMAIRMHGTEAKAEPFREVLAKLQTNAAAAMNSIGTEESSVMQDGFRYDFDDSSGHL